MHKPRDVRHPVLIRGRMRADGPAIDVCVRNVSKNGMMLQAQQAPRRGTFVEVRLPEDVIVGQVVWASDRRFGIRTRERVPVWRLTGKPKPPVDAHLPRQPAAAGTGAVSARGDARTAARATQFLFLGLAVAAMAVLLALASYQTLSALTQHIGAHL